MHDARGTRSLRLCALGCALAIAGFLSGCGERTRYPISGKVTYDGKPVPAGSVVFVPDVEAGNSGSSAVAEIKNGTFSIDKENGVYGGRYVVQVNGADGVAAVSGEGGLEERGKPLFEQYRKKMELPAQDHVLDINVPGSAAPLSRPGGKKTQGDG